ncbi:MAG TPA: transcriptional regulator [Actinomycetota bacterium]|nr:transcriptional regulator [Actinomycetota bacterium]
MAASRGYGKELGRRLRAIRQQKGMSLHEVQESSSGRWKAAVVGAYERGDRNVTVARLAELASFYGVPLAEILPGDERPAAGRADGRLRLVLDLESLERVPRPERDRVERFAAAIQRQRGDFNGRVLTIRHEDIMSLALLYEVSAEELGERLFRWGLLVRD